MAEQTIVLVDGDGKYRKNFAEALELSGYGVRQWGEAQPAWEDIVDNEPTLIISEVDLPDATGMALLRAYRRAFPERKTPFVFLSHSHEPERIVRSLEAGADDHWSKVNPLDDVTARVTTTLRRRQSIPPAWRQDGPQVVSSR